MISVRPMEVDILRYKSTSRELSVSVKAIEMESVVHWDDWMGEYHPLLLLESQIFSMNAKTVVKLASGDDWDKYF